MSGRRSEMYRRTISNPQCRRIMPLQHEARDLHFFHLTYETLTCLLHLNILFYTISYHYLIKILKWNNFSNFNRNNIPLLFQYSLYFSFWWQSCLSYLCPKTLSSINLSGNKKAANKYLLRVCFSLQILWMNRIFILSTHLG